MVDATEMLDRARRIADDVLAPMAETVDRTGLVPSTHFDALAAAGLFGIVGPRSSGGSDLGPEATRRIFATIAGGCGSTFFVWAQHHGVVRMLASAAHVDGSDESRHGPRLAELCSGRRIAGTAFAHVRRPGRPAIAARRDGEGWRIDGHAPWATSWGIADEFSIASVSDAGRLVWAMLAGPDGRDRGDVPSAIVATPLQLPVFQATGTVAIDFTSWEVPDDEIVHVEPVDRWREADRAHAAFGSPAVLGVAGRAVGLLRDVGDRDAIDAADRLTTGIDHAWATDGELLRTSEGSPDSIRAASDHRARCLGLGRTATTALLAAVGGRGMELGHPAQRLAREAAFHVIQAQTADGRAATLRRS